MVHRKLSRRHKLSFSIVLLCIGLAIGALTFWQNSKITSPKNSRVYDVVVVGAGPGGIAASIQAARSGAKVALLEETDWVGGQIASAGVGTMDEGSTAERNSGLYKEFVGRVTEFYKSKHKSVDTCYYSLDTLCVDPKVARDVLNQMLQAEHSHLDVYTRTRVTSVDKAGNKVTGVETDGGNFASRVVIDAGEYGDVIAQAGASFRLGNGTSESPKPSSCVQTITHAAVIKYYPEGVPSALKFKQAPPGYTPNLVRHFAAFLKKDGYDLMPRANNSRYIGRKSPMSFTAYTSFRGYPDLSNTKDYNAFEQNGHTITRTSLNLGNDFPRNGTLESSFVSDPSKRTQSSCQAKLLTLQLLYYIQHDLGQSNWSIADDEGYDTDYNKQHHCPDLNGYETFEDNMSQEPYIREGRRLIGAQTLTGNELQYTWKDTTKRPTYSDSIAVGYYPMDVHGCNTEDTLEPAFDSTSDINTTFEGAAFEVPLGVLIPQKIDGLLAAEKNISVSRLAEGAIREQPIAMNIGQAAGELAALAAKTDTSPRLVSASKVQAGLKTAHVVTSIGVKK